MIYIKNYTTTENGEVCMDEDTEFYTDCGGCGKLLEDTDEIIDNFGEYLFGGMILYCEECSAKRRAQRGII